jgi:uncharacterized membrane protein YkoI
MPPCISRIAVQSSRQGQILLVAQRCGRSTDAVDDGGVSFAARPFDTRHAARIVSTASATPCYSGGMTHANPPLLRRPSRLASAFGLALALGMATAALADGHDDKEARRAAEMTALRNAVARKEIQPLPRIIALAQRRVPGEVVKTELEAKRSRLIYEVKILTPTGRVREVKLDARTGAILEVEDD